MSLLLYFTVALLPSGDTQETPPNAHKHTNAHTCKLPSSTSLNSQKPQSTVTHHHVFNTHMMCMHTHTLCWWCYDSPAILTPSSLIPCLVTLTFTYFPPFVCEEENESGRKEERKCARRMEGWKEETKDRQGMEDERGRGVRKVGMKGCEEKTMPGIETERGSKKRTWWEKKREEDLEGETGRAINKVNRRQLRDTREIHVGERNKGSERGRRWKTDQETCGGRN